MASAVVHHAVVTGAAVIVLDLEAGDVAGGAGAAGVDQALAGARVCPPQRHAKGVEVERVAELDLWRCR